MCWGYMLHVIETILSRPRVDILTLWHMFPFICFTGHSACPVGHYVGSPIPAFRPPRAPASRTRVYDCQPISTNTWFPAHVCTYIPARPVPSLRRALPMCILFKPRPIPRLPQSTLLHILLGHQALSAPASLRLRPKTAALPPQW